LFLGYLAAVALLCGILYTAPRLVGFEVDLWATTCAALLIVSLLALEWGFIDPENA
jgi:ABC-type amino acid transport substrate-binding protein